MLPPMDDRTGIPGSADTPQGPQPFVTRSAEPDWQSLADQYAASGRRRRRLRIAGSAVAVLCVLGAGAGAVALTGGNGGSSQAAGGPATATGGAGSVPAAPWPAAATPTGAPSTSASATASASPTPSRTAKAAPTGASARPSASGAAKKARPTPLQIISDASTDTAPLTPAGLFSATTVTIGGSVYTRAAVEATTPCWKATTGGLGNVLTPHGCLQLLRATYLSGRNEVTVGVAVFDTAEQAAAVLPQYTGQIQSLVRGSVPSFCVNVACALTHASIGRYDYFTVAGTSDKAPSTGNPVSVAAGRSLAGYASGRLLARG